MDDLSRALDIAVEAATSAGRIASKHFGRNVQRERKADGSWVTEADWAVEAQIRLRIARAFPDHNILGEEEGLTAAGGGEPNEGAPTWIVDPIDGTHNFMVGIPIWASLIALRIDDASVLGVAHAPELNETYSAASGRGAHFNGSRIEVSGNAWADATFVFSNWQSFVHQGLKNGLDAIAQKAWRTRGFGDFWGHMLVARGAADLMIEPELSIWDVAGLEPIVREAGGRITGLDGSPWTEGGCITSNGVLHDEALRLLKVRDA